MTHSMRTLVLLAVVTLPGSVHAQGRPPLDSAQQVAMMAQTWLMNQPAAFVLRHQSELGLSPMQVTALEALTRAERDSTVVRQARLAIRMQTTPPSAAMVALGSWSGELDEAAVREALCQQSANQVDFMLGLAQDRRAAAALLTAAQAAQLARLQASDLMNAIKRP